MTPSTLLGQLKKEHEDVKLLFKKAEDCDQDERADVLQEIKEELVPHARGEEKTIYSLLKGLLDNEDASEEDLNLANEAYEEHRVIDELLKSLESINANDEKWIAHLKVLKENVEHHIKEEELELFELIKKHFTADKLTELKAVYLSVKERFADSLPSQAQIRERQPSSEAASV